LQLKGRVTVEKTKSQKYFFQIFKVLAISTVTLPKHKGNIKQTLKIIRQILNKNNDKSSITSNRFRLGDQWIEDPQTIANHFNKFFSSVGPETNQKVDPTDRPPDIFLNAHMRPNGCSCVQQKH
jgi:hypothetical protein